jgi:hypothetical protein
MEATAHRNPATTADEVNTLRARLGLDLLDDVDAAASAVRINNASARGQKAPATTDGRELAELLSRAAVVNGLPVGDYRSAVELTCDSIEHWLSIESVVGYVIVEQVGELAYDVAVIGEAAAFGEAVGRLVEYNREGRHAVIGHLYRCGCRS